MKTEKKPRNENEQNDAIRYVAEILQDQCARHRMDETDTELTEEDITSMFYDHLLSELAQSEARL